MLKRKQKFITTLFIVGLIATGGLSIFPQKALSQSYIFEFPDYHPSWGKKIVAWDDTYHYNQGAQSWNEVNINLPQEGLYGVYLYYNADSGTEQLHEEVKLFVDGTFLGTTTDPNIGNDYENEYLGDYAFSAGEHLVRVEHAWNFSDFNSPESVVPIKVSFVLKSTPSPNLVITKSVNLSNAQTGDILNYSLTYQNTGNATATNVVLVDYYPQNYLEIENAGGGNVSQNKISWNIGTLAPGAWGGKSFSAKVKDLAPGIYEIENYAILDSEQLNPIISNTVTTTVTVAVNSNNHPPVADAGPNLEVEEGGSVTLLGSGSDPDNDPITYSWNCSGGNLSLFNVPQPIFTAPSVDFDFHYVCRLTVTDSKGLSDSDTMTVLVKNKDTSLAVETLSAINIQKYQATLRGYLNDLGGENSAYVYFEWDDSTTYTRETDHIKLTAPGMFEKTIFNLTPGKTYYFRAVADNGKEIAYGENKTFITPNEENRPPVADAGPDKTIFEKTQILIGGSSYDPDNDPITYSWNCSGGNLSNKNVAHPIFYAPSVVSTTTYSCTLLVVDSHNSSDSDSMSVIVKPKPKPTFEQKISLKVEKTAKNLSQNSQWGDTISASPSDILMFKITVQSLSNISLKNVMVRDMLPSKIVYQGNLKINGQQISGNITQESINLGTFNPNEKKEITFLAKIAPKESFTYGTTNLYNSVVAYNDQTAKTNVCTIKVQKIGVTSISTGVLDNPWFKSLFLPLFLSVLIMWAIRSKIVGLDEILHKRKQRIRYFRAKKKLIRKLKNKHFI